LRLQRPLARMETRPPNVEGTGAVTIRQLVLTSLRMRPTESSWVRFARKKRGLLQAIIPARWVPSYSVARHVRRATVWAGWTSWLQATRIWDSLPSASKICGRGNLFGSSRFSDGTRRHHSHYGGGGMGRNITPSRMCFCSKNRHRRIRKINDRPATGIRPNFYYRLKSAGLLCRRSSPAGGLYRLKISPPGLPAKVTWTAFKMRPLLSLPEC